MARFTMTLVNLPLRRRFTTSFGSETQRNGFIIRLQDEGVTAYSECVASRNPFYGYEDNATVLHIIEAHLAALARDLPGPEEFLERASAIRGHNMAKAAVEMLLWDYRSKMAGEPLHRMLGESRGFADVGISLGIEKTAAMVTRVGEALERGYKRIKVKIERGRDLDVLRTIRRAYPRIPLSADANACYSLDDINLLRRLDRFDLLYLEQPLGHDDLVHHARLRRELSTPVCLDESVSSVERAEEAFEVGALDVVNIKPGRLGGLTNSLEVLRLARRSHCHAWVGGMLETGVGRSFNIALASHELVDCPGDTSPNEKYFSRDIVANPFVMRNGTIRPNEGPGIGIAIDRRSFREAAVTSRTI